MLRNEWFTLLRNEWFTLLRNRWFTLLRNRWFTLPRNTQEPLPGGHNLHLSLLNPEYISSFYCGLKSHLSDHNI
ncbi:MAG: hypothetical protein ACK5ZX_01800, partial [Bacteroidota bacterium]